MLWFAVDSSVRETQADTQTEEKTEYISLVTTHLLKLFHGEHLLAEL